RGRWARGAIRTKRAEPSRREAGAVRLSQEACAAQGHRLALRRAAGHPRESGRLTRSSRPVDNLAPPRGGAIPKMARARQESILAERDERAALSQFRELADRMFSRAAGAALVGGNQVRLLVDGAENYSAWLAAIRDAQSHVHFENYFIVDDEVGREF